MAETVSNKQAVLTEDMIDAAMCQSLKNTQDINTNQKDTLSDHNYCEEAYSSDSDYQVESVDGFSSDSSQASLNDDTESKKTNESPHEDIADRCEDIPENGEIDEENVKIISLKPNDGKSSLINTESSNSQFESGVIRKGLIIKPLTNLLKADLVQEWNDDQKNLKVFKCINGKLQMVPDSAISSAEKRKYLSQKNTVHGMKINSNRPSTYLQSFLGHDFKNKKKSNLNHCESLSDKTSSDCNSRSSPVEKSSNSGQIKNNKILRTYKNNSNSNNSVSRVPASEVDVDRLEKTPTLNSLLKSNVNKLNNNVESKDGIEKKSVSSDVSSRLSSENNSPVKNMNDALYCAEVCDITSEGETSANTCDDDDITMESVTEPSDSLPALTRIQKSKLNTSSKLVNVQSDVKERYLYKKKFLPKINYRYHTKDKLIISDRLPSSTTTTVISLNNKTPTKDTFIKLGTSSSTNNASKNMLLPSHNSTKKTEKKAAPQSVVKVNRPKYLRSVINSIITPTTTVTKSLPSTVVLPKSISVKDKSIMVTNSSISSSRINTSRKSSENWEKLDHSTMLSKEQFNNAGLNLLISQITVGEVPSYKPTETKEVYPCLECGDRFALESSLREHKLRKSVLIIYWCRTCSCCLNLYNRCMFLAHIRSHNQIFKNLDMTCLSLEPIPKRLLRMSSLEFASSTSNNVPSNSCIINASESSAISTPSADSSTSALASADTTDSEQQISLGVVSDPTEICHFTQKSDTNEMLPATVSVLDPSDQDVTEDSIEKNMEVLSDCNNDGIVVINENDGSDNLPLQDNMDVAVTTPTAEHLAELQYKILSSTKEYIDSDSNGNKQVKGRRKCSECGLSIAPKGSLRKHLQNYNKPLSDNLKCDICHLILQSPCSLRMHLRIHMKKKPFRCPECAIEFNLFDRFIMHLKYTCCHMTKVVRYVCSVCNSMLNSVKNLEEHLLTRHVRSIFKCGGCPVAFISIKGAEKHKEKEHPGRIVPTQSYQQCKLCPEKLIPKKKFLIHMKSHLLDEKVRIYAFQCPTCKYTFFHRTELVYHRMKCDSREGIIKSVLKEDVNVETADSNVTDILINDDEVEFVVPSKKRKMSHEDEIEVIQEEEKDPLSLEDFQLEEPLKGPVEETCVVCKTEKVLILPGKDQSSQSLCCKKCVKPCGVPKKSDSQKFKLTPNKMKGYKCKICDSPSPVDFKSILLHFKSFHKEFEGQSINQWLIVENNCSNVKKSNTVTTAETIKEKYKKKRASSALGGSPNQVQIKEEPDIDSSDKKECVSPDKKKPKKCSSKQKIMTEGKQFESGKILTPQETKNTEFSCCECEFVGTSKDEFRNHVISHRLDPNALQCLECGECFVVLPSLEKHLIINHRITDVNKYINENKQSMPLSYFEEESVNGLANDGSVLSKTCKVCYEVFESKPALDKHFRSHGMAFLFKKQQQ